MIYNKGIHPDCGKKYKFVKDILMTPFYTESFCDELVGICEEKKKEFAPYIVYNQSDGETDSCPWDTLFFKDIQKDLFKNFCIQYKERISPLLYKKFQGSYISGWFCPMIIKYHRKGQNVKLHNDTSKFTLNVKLNTDFEGCHVEFPRQKWTNKDIPKGWCFVWPSQVTHPHVAYPLMSGTKYSLSSWTHPVSWDQNKLKGSIYDKDIK